MVIVLLRRGRLFRSAFDDNLETRPPLLPFSAAGSPDDRSQSKIKMTVCPEFDGRRDKNCNHLGSCAPGCNAYKPKCISSRMYKSQRIGCFAVVHKVQACALDSFRRGSLTLVSASFHCCS